MWRMFATYKRTSELRKHSNIYGHQERKVHDLTTSPKRNKRARGSPAAVQDLTSDVSPTREFRDSQVEKWLKTEYSKELWDKVERAHELHDKSSSKWYRKWNGDLENPDPEFTK